MQELRRLRDVLDLGELFKIGQLGDRHRLFPPEIISQRFECKLNYNRYSIICQDNTEKGAARIREIIRIS